MSTPLRTRKNSILAGLLILILSLVGCAEAQTATTSGTGDALASGAEGEAASPPAGTEVTLQIQALETIDRDEGTYWQYIENEDGVYLLITPSGSVRSFKFVTVRTKEVESELRYSMDNVRCLYDEVTPDKPFVVKMLPVGALPTYGVAFTDQNDRTRLYTINMSGLGPEEGGGYFLQEVN